MGDNSDSEYKWCIVEGRQCIEWIPLKLPDDSRAAEKLKTNRRKLKDKIANENLDVFMLDTQANSGKNQRQYCDIIFVSKKLDVWEKDIYGYFENIDYTIDRKAVRTNGKTSGFSLVLKSPVNDNLATISFWPGKNKVMVQPGNKDEQQLFQWMRCVNMFSPQPGKEDTEIADDRAERRDNPGLPPACHLQATSPVKQATDGYCGDIGLLPASKLQVRCPDKHSTHDQCDDLGLLPVKYRSNFLTNLLPEKGYHRIKALKLMCHLM